MALSNFTLTPSFDERVDRGWNVVDLEGDATVTSLKIFLFYFCFEDTTIGYGVKQSQGK